MAKNFSQIYNVLCNFSDVIGANLFVTKLFKFVSLHWTSLIIDRETREIMYLVASVRPSVRLSICMSARLYVRPLTAEPFDLRP